MERMNLVFDQLDWQMIPRKWEDRNADSKEIGLRKNGQIWRNWGENFALIASLKNSN